MTPTVLAILAPFNTIICDTYAESRVSSWSLQKSNSIIPVFVELTHYIISHKYMILLSWIL